MPTYVYICTSCHEEQDIRHKSTDPAPSECPKCHKGPLEKKFSPSFGVHFKGDGFYCTDYQKKTAPEQSHGCPQGACGCK